MADGFHDLQYHHLFRQQPQRPARKPRRRRGQTQRDHLRFLLPIQQLRTRWLESGLAVKSHPKAFHNQPLSEVLDRPGPTAVCLCDPRIRPAGAIGIRLEQHLGPADPLRRTLGFADNPLESLPFLIREANNVLLLHDGTTFLG